VSRHRNRLDQMAMEVKKRDEELKERDLEIAQLKEQMTPLENELATRTQSLQQLKEQLRDQEATVLDLTQELASARVALGEREQAVASLRDQLRTGKPVEAAEGQADSLSAPERLRLRIEQLSALSQQIESQRKELTREHSELKALSEDIARSHKRRKRRQRDLGGAEDEQEELRFAEETAALGSPATGNRIDTIDSESRRLEEQLAIAERETAELQAELKDLDATWTAKLAELSLAASPESNASEAVVAEGKVAAGTPETWTEAAEASGPVESLHPQPDEGEAKDAESEANVITLANRIRALQRDIIRR
jgi:chromosome segregation ATPase